MKTISYLRVSTDHQDQASQREQISRWLSENNTYLTGEVLDQSSGAKPWQERKLAGLLEASQAGDRIVVSEISRIARSTVGVLTFLQEAAARQVVIVAVRNKLALDDSMHSKITVTVLALAAEIERDLLRERTRAALQARKQRGLPLGRPIGSRSASILSEKADDIQRMMAAKVSKRAIARVLGCSPSTLYAFLKGDIRSNGDTRTQPLFPQE